MAHHKTDRLWKLEDSWSKVDIYVSGYAYEPKVEELGCDILVTSKTFSGAYTAVFAWADILGFARECAILAERVEMAADASPAEYSAGSEPPLSIRAESGGLRKVRWHVVCRPVMSEIEVLSLLLTTESLSGKPGFWRPDPRKTRGFLTFRIDSKWLVRRGFVCHQIKMLWKSLGWG
jgi:hypothetical protein